MEQGTTAKSNLSTKTVFVFPLEHIKWCLEVSWELRCNLTTTGKYYFQCSFLSSHSGPLDTWHWCGSVSLPQPLLCAAEQRQQCWAVLGQSCWPRPLAGPGVGLSYQSGQYLLSPFLRKCRWCDWAVCMLATFCVSGNSHGHSVVRSTDEFFWAWCSRGYLSPVSKLNNLFNIILNNETKLLTISIKYLILTN